MNIVDLAPVFFESLPVGVVITDRQVALPGPIILYVNSAFGRMVGLEPKNIVGRTPRFMQGKETRRAALNDFARALSNGERYHGYLTNYRVDGSKYRAEIDCRPLRSEAGQIDFFISFEREVVRRIGRPAAGGAGRYEPVVVSNALLGEALQSLSLFQSNVIFGM